MEPGALVEQFGVGGLFGIAVGYTAKKATKAMAILLGVLFICIQLLAHYHLITPHWDKVGDLAKHATAPEATSPLRSLMALLTANLPFGAAFMVGFAWGFRRG